jgi:chemotaxis protein methyltransferase CheR
MSGGIDVENAGNVQDTEVALLLEGVYRHYGFDFRQYAAPSIRRRILKTMQEEGLSTISELQSKVLHDAQCMERFLVNASVSVTSMFRDPSFFRLLRERVVPQLRTYPFTRLWVAGCATGEEVYSLAIILKEEGVYDRTRIYATDLSRVAIKKAEEAIYPLKSMQEYTRNYLEAGGTRAFSEYYTAKHDHVILRADLKENITLSQHNLVMDGSFNEFNLILCRNVMIYFSRDLQVKVQDLLTDSLSRLGFLGLGHRESLHRSPHQKLYEPLRNDVRLYRKR